MTSLEAQVGATPQHLYDFVVEDLRRMILNGELKPGEWIDEKVVADRLGLSRSPVREALKVLRTEGFVELWPRRGARVIRIDRTKAAELYQLLAHLEQLAGELAAQRASDRELRDLRALHDRMVEEYMQGELHAYFELNQQIHEAIVALSQSQTLRETYARLAARAKLVRFSVEMTPERWRDAVKEHNEIMKALTARDAERAGRLLTAHLNQVAALIEKQLDG